MPTNNGFTRFPPYGGTVEDEPPPPEPSLVVPGRFPCRRGSKKICGGIAECGCRNQKKYDMPADVFFLLSFFTRRVISLFFTERAPRRAIQKRSPNAKNLKKMAENVDKS